MKDYPSPGNDKAKLREQQKLALLEDVRERLEDMHAAASRLEAPDLAEWGRARIAAHDIVVRAQALGLEVLATCALRLEEYAAAIGRGEASRRPDLIQAALVAIETIDFELGSLSSEGR